MSTIKLGKITAIRSVYGYDTYVACICRSDSGFTKPYLAANTMEVDTYFGDFPFKAMLCKFIEQGIPVLLIPLLSPLSESNRCTLRLADDLLFQESHPKFGAQYAMWDDAEGYTPPDKGVQDGSKCYAHVIDFAKVPVEEFSDPSSYVITRVGGDRRNRMVIYFNSSSAVRAPINATYYDQGLECRVPVPVGAVANKLSAVAEIKAFINALGPEHPTTCTDIFDVMETAVDGFLAAYPIDISVANMKSEYADIDESDEEFNEVYGEYKEKEWKELESSFRKYMSGVDYLMCDTMLAVNVGTGIVKTMEHPVVGSVTSPEYAEMDSASFRTGFLALLRTEAHNAQLPVYSLCISYKTPGTLMVMNNMTGYNTFMLQSVGLDLICRRTEGSKLAEFYAKPKGSKGADITLTIEQAYKKPYCYDLTVESGDFKETIGVTTAGENYDEYVHLSSLGDYSALVDARLFDYTLRNGERISSLDFDDKCDEGETYDPPDSCIELPEGTWRLSRHTREVFDYDCVCESLSVLQDSEYYPDFLMVNELDYGANNKDFVDKLADFAVDKRTQVLVRIGEEHLKHDGDESSAVDLEFANKESRVMYFFGCYRYNGDMYTCAFPYAMNFINSSYIKRLDHGILYDVEGRYDKSRLKDLGVNYLEFNNYYYNYKTVRETARDPDAIVRFNTSKLSRLFLNGKYDFIGCPSDEIPRLIEDKIKKAQAMLPTISSITYGYNILRDILYISLYVIIPPLVNKEYVLNITLTIT
jgi:hypothetical protein